MQHENSDRRKKKKNIVTTVCIQNIPYLFSEIFELKGQIHQFTVFLHDNCNFRLLYAQQADSKYRFSFQFRI